MNVPRTADNSGDRHTTVSTLHIPASNTFIPFQQFSLSDGTTIRNPADDNNNKTLPVVSVVTAVTGLCPAVSMVSMQQPAQLAQTATIIPAVMTPIAVQAANCFTPTTTMTVSNTVNISSRLSIPTPHQHTLGNAGINISHQTGTILNNNLINHSIITTSCPQAPQGLPGIISTAPSTAANSIKVTNSPLITPTNILPAKSTLPNISSSAKSTTNTSPKTSSASSNQSSNPEQSDDLVKPVFKDGELVLEVECGQNKAILYLSKLCQGSKGPCINFQNSWLTPNEFQFVSGRETAKDWKRSIRHHGKSLKLLLAKGILNVHPTMCDCDGCRQGATLTRKGEKRRIPNGERKIKKPSSNSNSSGSCAEGSGIRPGTAPSVAQHLGAPGIPQGKPELAQVKPELKRPLGDMLKMADATVARGPPEANINSQRQNLCNKTPAVQRPDGQLPPKDFPKHKVISLNAVPTAQFSQTQVTTTATANPSSCATPVQPVCSPATVALSAAFSPSTSSAVTLSAAFSPSTSSAVALSAAFSPSTSSAATSHQTVTRVCASIDVTTQEAPKTIAIAAPLSPERTSAATVEGIVAGAALSVPEFHSKHLTLNPQIMSPNLSSSSEAHNPTPTTCDCTHLADESSDFCKNDKSDSGLSDDEDINVGNDTDDSFNTDSKSDSPDDDSDEECQEYSNQMSEEHDPICDTQTIVESSSRTVLGQADPPIDQKTFRDSFYSGLVDQKHHMDTQDDIHRRQADLEGQGHSYELKKHLDTQEHEPFPKTSTPISNMCGIYDSFRQTEAVSLQTTCSASTTLAIAAVSGAGSKPVSLSISTSNVKPEHVWIPPTVSPSASSSECYSTQHVQAGSSRNSRSPNFQSQQEKLPHNDGHNATSNKDCIKPTSFKKSDTSLESGQSVSPGGVSENCTTNVVLPYRNELVDDCQQAQNAKGPESDVGSKEINNHTQAQMNACRSDSSSDKSNKDRDREERHKLRQREDKVRREREERIKKDRDREERRDRERRDEKEAERLREEERERKGQSESRCGKDMPAGSPSSDQSRRPTGGVADAAAFSDYMRFLAAGHGHSFMSPASGYMCSFFPTQPQETALAPHLVHPLNSFSPQLGNLHKDPLLYQTSPGALANFGGPAFGHMPPVLHRPQYAAQQSILDYQRSFAVASTYPWAAAYPYFLQTSPSSATAANVAAGAKRSTTELEATMELSAKRMRYDGRFSEYTSPWDYFAAAAAAADYQHLRMPAMAPSLPCGLESTSMDKTAEYLRKRYMEYGPQAAMYLSALPEYARPSYQCACADHRDEDIRLWSVEDVCKFLSTLDGCGLYVEYFREQRVNGRILSMLTSDHLVSNMGMKLGSAVLLAEAVAKKMQDASKMASCEACRSIALSVPMHPVVLPL